MGRREERKRERIKDWRKKAAAARVDSLLKDVCNLDQHSEFTHLGSETWQEHHQSPRTLFSVRVRLSYFSLLEGQDLPVKTESTLWRITLMPPSLLCCTSCLSPSAITLFPLHSLQQLLYSLILPTIRPSAPVPLHIERLPAWPSCFCAIHFGIPFCVF